MGHNEERLKLILGPGRFQIALESLARTAQQRSVGLGVMGSYPPELGAVGEAHDARTPLIPDVFGDHGYLTKNEKGER